MTRAMVLIRPPHTRATSERTTGGPARNHHVGFASAWIEKRYTAAWMLAEDGIFLQERAQSGANLKGAQRSVITSGSQLRQRR
jgi:hypothetical protein